MKYKTFFKLLIIVLTSVMFSSCLEVETTINFSNNLSGTWILKYRIMQEVSYITPGTELSGYNYFPLSETELHERIAGVQGLALESLKTETNIMYTEYLVEMKFNSIDNIQSFFNNYVDNKFLTISVKDDGNFEMDINNPFPKSKNAETLNLISSLYSDKNINISVVFPGIVTESDPGLLTENPSEANLILTISELFKRAEPVKWIIKYE